MEDMTLMNKKFYFIKSEDKDEYNILFHEPTSSFAKIHYQDPGMYSDIELSERFETLDSEEQQDEQLFTGKGRIGLTFMSARTCNLSCKYCFAGEGEYGCIDSKPKVYNYESYMKAMKTASKMYPEGIKSISFFGGEPLIGFDEIKKFVPDCVKYFLEQDMQIPEFAISTNMVAMTRETAQFMKDFGIKAVISLDGPKYLNDYARVSADPSFSVYDSVVKNCRILDEFGVKYAVQATVNQQLLKNYKLGDGAKWLHEIDKINWENLAIVPVETNVHDLKIEDEHLQFLDSFTREITNYYIDELLKEKPGKIASGIIAPVLQIAKNKHVRTCSSGHSVFFDTDGSIYPCQMFCNMDDYKLGDIDNGWSAEKADEISNISRIESQECKNCIARNVCFMWCKGIQLLSNNDMRKICKPRCVFQVANTEECIKALVRIKNNKEKAKLFWENFKKVGERLIEDGFINK